MTSTLLFIRISNENSKTEFFSYLVVGTTIIYKILLGCRVRAQKQEKQFNVRCSVLYAAHYTLDQLLDIQSFLFQNVWNITMLASIHHIRRWGQRGGGGRKEKERSFFILNTVRREPLYRYIFAVVDKIIQSKVKKNKS